MSPHRQQELCVQKFLDFLPLYVREDARLEVQRVLAPYIREGGDDDLMTRYIAKLTQEQKVRPGFYKLIRELRRGKADVEASYTVPYEAPKNSS